MQPSKLNRLFIGVAFVAAILFTVRYMNSRTLFYGDACGYYLYLPSTFIYNNLVSLEPFPADKGINIGIRRYQAESAWKDADSLHINQYTYGIALSELPFFAAAHAFELARGSLANGFTTSYQLAVRLSTLVYSLLGILVVYSIVRRFHGALWATVSCILLFYCTNLLWFTVFQGGMSHVPLFFLYALLLHLTINMHEDEKRSRFVWAGLVAGFITVIRPTDIICVLIPLLYNVNNKETFRNKLNFIVRNRISILLAVCVAAIPVLPQIAYWKIMTGHWLYYSYGDQSFFWTDPKITEGLFHFSNGWLAYSPIMIGSILGMFFIRRQKNVALLLWVLIPLYIYIIYCWYCYRYINGLGSRPMLHVYPLLALPLITFVRWVWSAPRVWRVAFTIVTIFFAAFNVDASIRQMNGILWSEESNLQFNIQTLFKRKLSHEDLVVADLAEFQPDPSSLTYVGTIAAEHYNDSVAPHIVPDPVTGEKYVYRMQDEDYPSVSIALPCDVEKLKQAKWMKCSGRFMCTIHPDYFRHILVAEIGNKSWKGCKIENKNFEFVPTPDADHLTLFDFKLNQWGTVYFFTRIPKNISKEDIIKLYAWSPNRSELYLDDLKIELYR